MVKRHYKLELPEYEGSVTFIDVLGWKGIWRRGNPGQTVVFLELLFDTIVDSSNRLFENHFPGKNPTDYLVIVGISDTIALMTKNIGNPLLEMSLQASVLKLALEAGVCNGLPLRGATTYGHYRIGNRENILVGEAIDDAATWHEETNWCGVVLTPHAKGKYCKHELPIGWIDYDKVPFKTGDIQWPCLDWRQWQLKGKTPEKAIADLIDQSDTLLPTVLNKYQNTLSFLISK